MQPTCSKAVRIFAISRSCWVTAVDVPPIFLVIFVKADKQMKQKIYIDTSIVGGYFDEEFKEATIKLFERLDNNEIIFVISDLLDLELLHAPQRVREQLLSYTPEKFQRV